MKEVKSILEFDEGSILTQVQKELQVALHNIADINTDTKPREITIKLKLTPDDKRKHLEMTASVTSKLRPAHAIKTSMQMSITDTEVTAMELVPFADGQKDLFGEIHETKIVKFEKKEII